MTFLAIQMGKYWKVLIAVGVKSFFMIVLSKRHCFEVCEGCLTLFEIVMVI